MKEPALGDVRAERPRHPIIGIVLEAVGAAPLCLTLMAAINSAPETFGVSLVISALLFFVGEELRRGNIHWASGRRGDPDSPAITMVRMRVLGVRTHAVWAVVGAVAGLFLVMGPAIASVLAGAEIELSPLWNYLLTGDDPDSREIVGFLALGFGVTPALSLYKKVHYRKVLRERGTRALKGAEDEDERWRWRALTYRWRADVMLGFLGGVVGGFGIAMPTVIGWSDDDERIGAIVFGLGFLLIGAGLFVAGMALAARYWKAGKPLGMAESA
ncbi:hypothetical protein [Gryllotalpicola ginsengisoli]|uniref:hypothetical protein n=1 Tax=Gryllotalpicola ginsengisoli TaxID=444608 RepID=UPI0012DEEF8F|nr:hypothetical protein [Gryllotalpicola ginsengisoli]